MSRTRFPRLIETLAAAALLAVAGVCASAALAAQPATASSAAPKADAGGPRWSELSAAHRKVLAPLSSDWDGLDSRSKERWLDVAGRYPKMRPQEQQRTHQRMAEWAHMTVAQRTQARSNFQEIHSLSKEEREARWKAYQALPEDEKRKLAAKRVAAPPGAASGPVVVQRRHVPPPLGVVQPKNNVVTPAAPARIAAGSAPAAAGQRPGVTTTLLTRRAAPPPHQRDGGLKIAAGPNSVDRTTLLPKHPGAAAARTAASGAAAVKR